ncbi:MAG: ERG4/ERG24 family protein [Propionibacteriaceae bacterium]|nr:ERG4/ERG24 family protein [Propionibacteriaceae bacterium]
MTHLLLGLITPLVAYAIITALHVVIPTRKTVGYVTDEVTGQTARYRLNGKYVLVASIIIWFLLGYFHVVPFTWLYETRWLGLVGACIIGLAYSIYVVITRPSTGKPFISDLWFGRAQDPQFRDGLIDAKVWFYMIGAVMLQLNVLSCAAYQILNVASINPGFILACGMLTWFCFDYLVGEKVHLWTYDYVAERVGFKLGFGCLAFYPYFYAVALWFTATRPNPGHAAWFTVVCGGLYLIGWVFTRGANMQKYFFKVSPEKKFLGMTPVAIGTGDRRVLVSGFWGLSRHINYMGEIVQGIAVALAVGYAGVWIVWLYPAYYIALLFSRQADDDKVCQAKYGATWDEYTASVKYRVIPFIY